MRCDRHLRLCRALHEPFSEYLMKSRCRGVDRCEFGATYVPYARYLAQVNRQDRLAASYLRAGNVLAARVENPACTATRCTGAETKVASTLPKVGDVSVSPAVQTDVRLLVTYQVNVPTTRGAVIDILG